MTLGVTGSAANATSHQLDLDDCDAFGCEGSQIFLGVDDLGGGDYKVTLTLDSTNYTGSKDGLVQAGFKAFSSIGSISLISDPGGSWTAPVDSPVNSGSLCGSPTSTTTSGHLCTSGFVDISAGGLYTWEYRVTNATLLGIDSWHIGFQYGDASIPRNGYRGKIISASGGLIPEPSAALVFGAALLLVGPRLRRRR